METERKTSKLKGIPTPICCHWSTVQVYSAGLQCKPTVRLGQQTVMYDSNPPAATDPSAFFCPHLQSEPIQVHACQFPHSPPPHVFCFYMWKTSKTLFCFFLLPLLWLLFFLYNVFLISVSFCMNYLKLAEGIFADVSHTFVMYTQYFVFSVLLLFSCFVCLYVLLHE